MDRARQDQLLHHRVEEDRVSVAGLPMGPIHSMFDSDNVVRLAREHWDHFRAQHSCEIFV